MVGSELTASGSPREGRRWVSVTRWGAAAGLLVGLLLVSNHELIVDRAVPLWDAQTQFSPYFTLVADFARAGQLLVWNPLVNCGSPDFVESQFGAMSPFTVALAFVTGGGSVGFTVYWLAIWLLGGLGVLVLGRSFGTPPWGTTAVAVGFLFCGIYTGQAQHLSHLCSFSFLPWLLWRWDQALLSGRQRPAIEAGLLWGLSALSGYAGLTVLSGGYLALWGVGRWLFPARDVETGAPGRGRPKAAAVVVGLATVLAAGISVMAPAYLGFFVEGTGFTERADGLPREIACYDNALHPLALATLFSPRLVTLNLDLKAVGLPTLFDYNRPSTSSIFVGPVVLALALFALVTGLNDRWRWWLLAVGLAFLVTALGRALPLRSVLYDVFPISRYFRQTSMFRHYFVISLVVLALYGARELSRRLAAGTVPKSFVVICCAMLAVAATVFVVVVWPWHGHADLRDAAASLVLGFGALAVFAMVGLHTIRRTTALLPILVLAVAVSDAIATQQVSRPTLYAVDPQSLADRQDLRTERRRQVDLTQQGLRRWDLYTTETIELTGRNLVLKQPAFEDVVPLGNRLHLTLGHHPLLRATAIGSRRVFFATDAVACHPSMEVLGELGRAADWLGAPPLVVHSRKAMRQLKREPPSRIDPDLRSSILRLPATSPLDFELLAYRPRELDLEVEAPAPGWLLVTDRWAGGWRATVNDQPVEVWGGNLVFRAVRVEAGHNHVRFSYPVPWLLPLLVLSWGSLAAGLIAALASARRTDAASALDPRIRETSNAH